MSLLTDPWRHQDCTGRKRILVITEIHEQRQGKAAPCAISSDDDILWRYVEVIDESQVRRHNIVQRAWETCFGRQAVVHSYFKFK